MLDPEGTLNGPNASKARNDGITHGFPGASPDVVHRVVVTPCTNLEGGRAAMLQQLLARCQGRTALIHEELKKQQANANKMVVHPTVKVRFWLFSRSRWTT